MAGLDALTDNNQTQNNNGALSSGQQFDPDDADAKKQIFQNATQRILQARQAMGTPYGGNDLGNAAVMSHLLQAPAGTPLAGLGAAYLAKPEAEEQQRQANIQQMQQKMALDTQAQMAQILGGQGGTSPQNLTAAAALGGLTNNSDAANALSRLALYGMGGNAGLKPITVLDENGNVTEMTAREAQIRGLAPVVKDAYGNIIQSAGQRNAGGGNVSSGGNQIQTGGQTTFGFDNSDIGEDPAARKLAQKNSADFEKSQQQREALTNAIKTTINQLRPNLESASGGGYKELPLMAGSFFQTSQGNAADLANSLTQGLALNLSNLQNLGGQGRAMKAALTTLLNSKPDPYTHPRENNISNLNHIEATINQYDMETKLMDAYKSANPLKVIGPNAENLYDAMSQIYPFESPDPNNPRLIVFNKNNVKAFENAIPDAIANPQKYFQAAKGSGTQQSQSAQQTTPAQQQQQVDPVVARQHAVEAIKAGAPRTAVIERLTKLGVPTDGL